MIILITLYDEPKPFVSSRSENIMVSYDETYRMIRISWNLGTLHLLSYGASLAVPATNVPVKGDSGILKYLEVIPVIIDKYSEKYPDLKLISTESSNWIRILENEYSDPKKFGIHTKPINLTTQHGQQLGDDIGKWYDKIYVVYDKPQTKLIEGNEFTKQSVELLKKLKNNDKLDLIDAYDCITNGLSTPAVMMLYRIGESMVRKYYELEIGCSPTEGTTMGGMANEIRLKQAEEINQKKRNKPDSLLNYILSQIDDRNLAQHPEKRFNQTEAEEVFIFIKKLINDVSDKLKK